MVKTLAFASMERLPCPGSWEEAVKPTQALTAPEILADDVMTDLGERHHNGRRLI